MTEFNGSSRSSVRAAFVAFGWLNLILGIIGTMVPVMPSMVFLLLALWSFSKGSERFHTWLYQHKFFGPSLRLWSEHRVIPMRAKIASVAGFLFSVAVLVALTPQGSTLLYVYSAINAVAIIFIVSRRSTAPENSAPENTVPGEITPQGAQAV